MTSMIIKFSSFAAFQVEKMILGKTKKHRIEWYGVTSVKMVK